MKAFLLAASIGLVALGCSTEVEHLRYNDTGVTSSTGVQLLRDPPRAGVYQSLGERSWSFYRPGFHEPTISDVWDDLSQRVRSAGGDACLVKYQYVSTWTARSIDVTCDVLKRTGAGGRSTGDIPASNAGASVPPGNDGRFLYTVDRLLKDGACKASQTAKLISSGAGVETYSSTCANGATAVVQCELDSAEY